MRFEVTKRDAVILSIFIIFLIACCYMYVRHMTAPKSSGRTESEREVLVVGESASEGEANAQRLGDIEGVEIESLLARRKASVQKYAAIWQRNIFKPPLEPAQQRKSSQSLHGRSVAGGSPVLLPPLPPPTGAQSQFQPTPPLGGMEGNRPFADKPRNIAYTAFVVMGDRRLALVENTSTKEGFYVREGDYVFGMRVVRIAPDAIELERDGRSIYYALGENKDKKELMAKSVSQQRSQQPTSSTSQPQPTGQMQQVGQVQQAEQSQPASANVSPPPSVRRSEFFERMMQRMRERYGDNIPPDIEERIRRFRRRAEDGD